jgi:hypothetical protein
MEDIVFKTRDQIASQIFALLSVTLIGDADSGYAIEPEGDERLRDMAKESFRAADIFIDEMIRRRVLE